MGKVVRALAGLTRAYYRRPWMPAQEWVWNNWVRRYLLWRRMTLSSQTTFGAQMRSTFPNTIHARIYFFGFWEPSISAYLESRLQSGDTFVDIGANIGYHSLLASHRVGPNGKVFAFEASPSIFALLQENIASNSAHNIIARNVAVTDVCRAISIFSNQERLGESTILEDMADRIGALREAVVAGHPLGELIEPDLLRSARCIKIDVEGAEWLVAKGMRALIPGLSNRTEILVEINSDSTRELGGSAEALLGFFMQNGYSVFEINNSYEIGPYIRRDRPRLSRYDGKPFVQKDFVLKREHTDQA